LKPGEGNDARLGLDCLTQAIEEYPQKKDLAVFLLNQINNAKHEKIIATAKGSNHDD
jgi:hypothetical protein